MLGPPSAWGRTQQCFRLKPYDLSSLHELVFSSMLPCGNTDVTPGSALEVVQHQ